MIKIAKFIFMLFFVYPFILTGMAIKALMKYSWGQFKHTRSTQSGTARTLHEYEKRNWYMPEHNSLDNDIEQFRHVDGK